MATSSKIYRKKETSRSNMWWSLCGIFLLCIAAGMFILPTRANQLIDAVNGAVALGIPRVSEKPFQLGLDLRGGAHLLYEADVTGVSEDDKAAAVEGVRDVIERRVDALGVGESSVRTAKIGDSFRIDIEMPGIDDVNQAIARIGDTPILEFKEENTDSPRALTAEEAKGIATYNADAKKRAEVALVRIKKGEAFDVVAKEISEDVSSKSNGGYLGYVAKGASDPLVYDALKALSENQLRSNLLETERAYMIIKRGVARDGQMFVRASHILICSKEFSGCETGFTDEEAKVEAERIFTDADADNFADLAKEYSADSLNAAEGGDLGEFRREEMVPEFAEAAFTAKVGEIVGPVKTQFGYHIIYKTGEEVAKEYETWAISIKKQTESDVLPPYEEWKATGLSGRQLSRAEVVADPQTGRTQVALRFNDEGAAMFGEITKRNLKKRVAIFLDGDIISSPEVQSEITSGEAVITGDFNLAEARLLAQRLNAGALPIPVELISQETIGATLGANSLERSLRAGFLGMIVVMICMILYYRLPGVLASISLCIYLTLTLATFKFIGVTMSLSGIAGIILSIGMAVDANVLIFERTKEELRRGRLFQGSIEDGFVRAWSSIRDSNVSTLISASLMIWFGPSFVKGFATTLALGVLISMFTAITVTRLFLRLVAPVVGKKAPWLFLGYTKKTE